MEKKTEVSDLGQGNNNTQLAMMIRTLNLTNTNLINIANKADGSGPLWGQNVRALWSSASWSSPFQIALEAARPWLSDHGLGFLSLSLQEFFYDLCFSKCSPPHQMGRLWPIFKNSIGLLKILGQPNKYLKILITK